MKEIEEKLVTIFNHLGIPYSSIEHIHDDELDIYILSVSTDHGKYWLNKDGESLRSLNYLLRKMAPQEEGVDSFMVDVNKFQQKRLNDLKIKAKIIADRVTSFGADIEMDPMSSYDRMIVHSFLSKKDGVFTESIGEGVNRRLVVKSRP